MSTIQQMYKTELAMALEALHKAKLHAYTHEMDITMTQDYLDERGYEMDDKEIDSLKAQFQRASKLTKAIQATIKMAFETGQREDLLAIAISKPKKTKQTK